MITKIQINILLIIEFNIRKPKILRKNKMQILDEPSFVAA